MRKLLLLFLLSLGYNIAFTQESLKILTWDEALSMNPDSVYAIDASKMKWEIVPDEMKVFTSLRYLNLSKNKLVSIPEYFSTFSNLKVLDLTKNQLLSFPVVLCKMPQVQKLHVARNKIEMIPSCIQYMSGLKILDIWDNPITSLPEEFALLGNLTAVDMRGIMLAGDFQEKWIKRMPNVKWYFEVPCHCVD